jgi:hypothetical protein
MSLQSKDPELIIGLLERQIHFTSWILWISNICTIMWILLWYIQTPSLYALRLLVILCLYNFLSLFGFNIFLPLVLYKMTEI